MSAWSIGFGNTYEANTEMVVRNAHNSLFKQPDKRDMLSNRQKEDDNQSKHYREASHVLTLSGLSEDLKDFRKPPFCTKDNLLNSIAYVNQELELLGLPVLKFENGKCSADMYFFLNRLHDILELYHKTSRVKDDLETKNHRLSCESNHHQATCARLRREQSLLERELAQEAEKVRQSSLKCKQLANKLKAEREEVKRLTAVLQSRDIQHTHENKKKEREVVSLKERLHQLLADKVPDRKVGMDLMNVVSSGEGRRATWKTSKGKQDEEMYQLVIANYEERHREQMLENADLRDCLLSLQHELSALLKRTGNLAAAPVVEFNASTKATDSLDDTNDDSSRHSQFSVTELNEGYHQMPFDIVRKEIERAFKATCDAISEGMKKSLTRNVNKCNPSTSVASQPISEKEFSERRQPMTQPAEIDRLKKQINNYKGIIQQQEELLQQSLHSHSQSVETSFLHESQLLKEKENLSEQKKLFFEEKSAFEKERQAFAETAIRLGKERQALQEERSSLLKQQLLPFSPMKENQKPSSLKGDGHHPTRLLPPTPIVSPGSSNRGSGATTPVKFPTNTLEVPRPSIKLPASDEATDKNSSPDPSESKGSVGPVRQALHNATTIHFTPRTSPKTKDTRTSSTGSSQQTSVVQEISPTTPSGAHKASNFDAAASLESIRASLLRIRRSASQQE